MTKLSSLPLRQNTEFLVYVWYLPTWTGARNGYALCSCNLYYETKTANNFLNGTHSVRHQYKYKNDRMLNHFARSAKTVYSGDQ